MQLQPPPAPRGNPIASVRMACALRARRGMGDAASDQQTYKEISAYFKTSPALLDANPIGTFVPNLFSNIATSNLKNVIAHPVDTTRQIFSLATQTPGGLISKAVALTENMLTSQQTPDQYQGIKAAMAANMRKSGATEQQVQAAESQLDAYVRSNTQGLVGGVDPGKVPDTPPSGFHIPTWGWIAIGATGGLLLLGAVRR